jgi:rhodanese-related sulfurtransferase
VSTTDVDGLLSQARSVLVRLSPRAAYEAWVGGAELVDIRPAAQRASEGEVPGALLVERNVLEWRFDPASPARLPEATGHDVRVIVLCSEGYTSSLAAAALQQLGLRRATDVVGGFHAWRAAGLPSSDGDGRTTYASTGRAPGRRPARRRQRAAV